MPKSFGSRFGPKCREGFQRCYGMTRKGFRTSRRHTETSRFCEFRFREPFEGLVDGRSNIHGVPLATDNKTVVRHRLNTRTLNSATVQNSIASDSATFSMFCDGNQIRNCRHSSASYLSTSDRSRRLYRSISYATPRKHSKTFRTGSMAKFCPFID